MTEQRCQPIEVDGQPVIACGRGVTEGDLEAIREFQQFLKARGRWHEMANPRHPTPSSPAGPGPGGEVAPSALSRDDATAAEGAPNFFPERA